MLELLVLDGIQLLMICQWHESPLLTISCVMVDGGHSAFFKVLKFGDEIGSSVFKVSFLIQWRQVHLTHT